jgi:sortase B
MQKILVSVIEGSLKFSYKESNVPTIITSNTNVINDTELTFSKEYIKENQKIVSLFIKELCQEKRIYRVIIETNELAIFLLDLFKKNSYITALCIKENAPLTYSLYEKIIENRYLNYVEANTIQRFMIEMLDKNGIRSESRTETFYPSNFMQSNNLTSYSKIFYKMNIHINSVFTKEDEDDFLAFCNINKYLKTIHLDVFNKNDLENIIKILNDNKIKNINILIYENIKDLKTIEYLKKINHKIKKNKLYISLVYSKDYLKNNIFRQIIINTLKICGLIITILVVSAISYVGISNYVSLNEVTKIQENIKETINSQEEVSENEEQVIENHVIKNTYISSLYAINTDVVGWLKVNNTNIDYPVLQTTDNEYYLKHNLYQESDKNGWIFMDYRNSLYNLDANTIIYGHNMYYSGVMFGTLTKVYKKDWYTNPENLIISFDTIYESMNFEIFSIYKVPKTTDYLKTYFADDEEFSDYVKMIKDRSIKDFEIDVNPGDKILTLSTCTGENQRLVVHAKLIV